MAYSRRRPTGGYGVKVFNEVTKDDFFAAVAEAGFEVEVVRENKGAWNECRNFMVDGKVVGVVMKGERGVDWEAMRTAAVGKGR
jgi:nucleoside diphosphate kinase